MKPPIRTVSSTAAIEGQRAGEWLKLEVIVNGAAPARMN
jgi:hypothetical protein